MGRREGPDPPDPPSRFSVRSGPCSGATLAARTASIAHYRHWWPNARQISSACPISIAGSSSGSSRRRSTWRNGRGSRRNGRRSAPPHRPKLCECIVRHRVGYSLSVMCLDPRQPRTLMKLLNQYNPSTIYADLHVYTLTGTRAKIPTQKTFNL